MAPKNLSFKFRWFALLSGILFLWLSVQIFGENGIKISLISFLSGMVSGFILDVFATRFSLWSYPRQPFKSKYYFLIVTPAWGVFGMQVNVFWNFLRLLLAGEWISSVSCVGSIITAILFVSYEFPNLRRKSWQYS